MPRDQDLIFGAGIAGMAWRRSRQLIKSSLRGQN